jgi:hypothetical protein
MGKLSFNRQQRHGRSTQRRKTQMIKEVFAVDASDPSYKDNCAASGYPAHLQARAGR